VGSIEAITRRNNMQDGNMLPDASIDTIYAIDLLCKMMDDDVASTPSLTVTLDPESIWRDL
jgi:hypothetical protein